MHLCMNNHVMITILFIINSVHLFLMRTSDFMPIGAESALGIGILGGCLGHHLQIFNFIIEVN